MKLAKHRKQLATNSNDGAMRDFPIEGLTPLPHSGGSKFKMCTTDPGEYDDWKSTTERTLSVP